LYKYFTKVERYAIGIKIKQIIYEKMREEAYNGIMDTLVKTEYRDIDTMFGSAPIKAEGASITYTNAKYQVEQMIKQIGAMSK
jgi:hypothetical protein